MNYIDNIFLRSNIKQVCSYIYDGSDSIRDTRPYKVRLEEYEKQFFQEFDKLITDPKLKNKLLDIVNEYKGECEFLNFEMGFQAGMLLSAQIWQGLLPSGDYEKIKL